MTDTHLSPAAIAKAMQLRYIRADSKGYSRVRKGDKFVYLDTEGKQIRDKEMLKHIQGLVLPPAWERVWICPYPNGHLQATGYDVRGRKQYRYHARWSQQRNEHKFDRIYAFGKKLARLRRQISRDIRKKSLIREKVSAIALSVMNETYIRAGNTTYEKEYGSFGLTTLKNKHVSINGNSAFFRFKGKKGVLQQISLKDASLVRLLKNVRELPGQELFQYYDEQGVLHKLDSGDINDYLREHMMEPFTCKDFRTWAGCVLALQLMAAAEDFHCDADCKRNLVAIADGVAARLGNTRTVTRKYYIHPQLMLAYEQRALEEVIRKLKQHSARPRESQALAEKALLAFLKALQKK